jgi:hypothetical protein
MLCVMEGYVLVMYAGMHECMYPCTYMSYIYIYIYIYIYLKRRNVRTHATYTHVHMHTRTGLEAQEDAMGSIISSKTPDTLLSCTVCSCSLTSGKQLRTHCMCVCVYEFVYVYAFVHLFLCPEHISTSIHTYTYAR